MHIGYKRCGGKIITLEILGEHNENRTHHLECGKFRTSKAKVLNIENSKVCSNPDQINQRFARSDYYNEKIDYEMDKIITIHNYDECKNNVCSEGIHYFKTKEEAEYYFESVWNEKWFQYSGWGKNQQFCWKGQLIIYNRRDLIEKIKECSKGCFISYCLVFTIYSNIKMILK